MAHLPARDGRQPRSLARRVYREIAPPERLVFTSAWDQEDGSTGPETLVTITFAEEGGKTCMTFHQGVFNTHSNRDGHIGGWNSTFDRLEDYLKTTGARRPGVRAIDQSKVLR
jgi:uncharacterized protein YndB with AHSA1/START domain